MIYTSNQFIACTFNPLITDPMLDCYPKLSEIIYPEWTVDENLDALIRYVIMVYDPKSPLVINERDLNYRKNLACELAGMDQENEELMSSIVTAHYLYLPELTLKYLMRFARSKEWAAICAYEAAFWESIKKLMEPINGKTSKEELESVQKKSAIKDEIDKDIKRLDEYYRRFLGEDEDLEKKVRQRLSPELMAEKR